MGGRLHSTGYLTEARKVESAITIHDVRALRNRTPIGTKVKFRIKNSETDDGRRVQKANVITGVVTGKFPHVVVLDGKYTYTWKDMLLGNVEVIN